MCCSSPLSLPLFLSSRSFARVATLGRSPSCLDHNLPSLPLPRAECNDDHGATPTPLHLPPPEIELSSVKTTTNAAPNDDAHTTLVRFVQPTDDPGRRLPAHRLRLPAGILRVAFQRSAAHPRDLPRLFYRARLSGSSSAKWSARVPLQMTPGPRLADPTEWGGAQWICSSTRANDTGSTALRRHFHLPPAASVASAVAHVVGLGQYSMTINGHNVMGTEVEAPAWTDWRRRVMFSTYAIAAGVFAPGDNVIDAVLGNGMYNVPNPAPRYTKWTGSYGPRMLLLRLDLTLGDGQQVTVTTAPGAAQGWVATEQGPITFTHVYGGEDNSGVPLPAAGAAGGAWTPAANCTAAAPAGATSALVPRSSPPVVVAETIKLASTSGSLPYSPTTTLLEFERSFAGTPQITVSNAVAGDVLRATPFEARVGVPPSQCSGGCPMYWRQALPPALLHHSSNSGGGGGGGGTMGPVHHLTLKPTFSTYGFRWVELLYETATASTAGNGTISVLGASYGACCNSSLTGDETARVAAACNGHANCTVVVCVCNTGACAPSAPCQPDPAAGCGKDLNVTYRCTGDAPAAPARTAYLPPEANGLPLRLSCGAPPRRPLVLEATGLARRADVRQVGQWHCSNALVNQIHEITVNAIKANLQSVLTDCPHR